MSKSYIGLDISGYVKITDSDTGEIIFTGCNDIHNQNMARVIARGLAHEDASYIHSIRLGNGGTHILPNLTYQFLPPNVVSVNANLYNTTYTEIIDDVNSGNGSGNSVISSPAPLPSISSFVTNTIELSAIEPAGQPAAEGINLDPEAPFVFDELGLFSSDGLLLTHIIFSPREKTAASSFIIEYTLTIQVDSEPL